MSKKTKFAFSIESKNFLEEKKPFINESNFNQDFKQNKEAKKLEKKLGRPKKNDDNKVVQINLGLTKKQIEKLKKENEKLPFPMPSLSQFIVARMKQLDIID